MYISEQFKKAWAEWKQHKVEKHGMPYTPTSEQKALSGLFLRSHGIEELAIASIDYSIEGNWASVYIKPNFKVNGKQFNEQGQATDLRSTVQAEFDKRFGGRGQG